MQIRSFSSGETIFKVGDRLDFAYIISSGDVALAAVGAAPRIAGKGEMLGEIAIVTGEPSKETATARSVVTLEAYSADELEQMVYSAPPAVQQLVIHLTQRMAAAELATPSASSGPSAASGASAAPMDQFAASMERFAKMLDARCGQMERAIGASSGAAEIADGSGGAVNLTQISEETQLSQIKDMGPLQPLLEDETINDVLVNGTNSVFIERAGKLEKTAISFPSDAAVREVAAKIVTAVGRKLDPRRPVVDARLLDGSRVNIIAQPLAVDGTSISIRKFSKKKITLDIMRDQTNMSEALAEFLKICGRCKLNIVISGGTGSGKTTLLNAVSQFIDDDERIVTIEDAAELQLNQPHVVRLETRPLSTGVSAYEEVSMRDLVRNALRMRPDRIIVGEVRGPEAFDMMQAMNTGHEGSLTTIHANHPRDALSRLENMIGMANLHIPVKSIRYQIASAIHLIVQVSRMRDGHRRITYISEIVGMEGDTITMHDLFNFVHTGEDEKGRLVGKFQWSGIMPRFIRRVAYYGEQDRFARALGIKFPKL